MKKYKPLFILVPLLLFLDHLTKYFIVKNFRFGEKWVVWPNFFDIVYVTNKGAAFGMLSDLPDAYREVFFYCITLLALSFLFYLYRKSSTEGPSLRLPIAMIVGGALGNILDRLFRGSVVDFLSFHWYDESLDFSLFGAQFHIELIWPAFNIADMAISVGVCLLLLRMYQLERQKKNSVS